MPADTCARCHRPVATTVNEYKQSGFLATSGVGEPTGNPRGMCGVALPIMRGVWNCGKQSYTEQECRDARHVWQVAEIERLTATLARVREACAVSEPVEWYSGRNVHAAIRNALRAEILALLEDR